MVGQYRPAILFKHETKDMAKKETAGRPSNEEQELSIESINFEKEVDTLERKLVIKLHSDIGKLSPKERADFFVKLLPYLMDKKDDVRVAVQWDLDALANKYISVKNQIDKQRKM